MKIQNILQHHIYGPGLEYKWEELNKISDISSENNLQNIEGDTIERIFDWTEVYGKLEERRI